MSERIDLKNGYYLENNEVHFIDSYSSMNETVLNERQVYAIKALFKEYIEQKNNQM